MKRSEFMDETHWDLGAAFLSVRPLPSGHRASVAKLDSHGEYVEAARALPADPASPHFDDAHEPTRDEGTER